MAGASRLVLVLVFVRAKGRCAGSGEVGGDGGRSATELVRELVGEYMRGSRVKYLLHVLRQALILLKHLLFCGGEFWWGGQNSSPCGRGAFHFCSAPLLLLLVFFSFGRAYIKRNGSGCRGCVGVGPSRCGLLRDDALRQLSWGTVQTR